MPQQHPRADLLLHERISQVRGMYMCPLSVFGRASVREPRLSKLHLIDFSYEAVPENPFLLGLIRAKKKNEDGEASLVRWPEVMLAHRAPLVPAGHKNQSHRCFVTNF